MPIYAYRCAVCGHAKDVLQKISDPLLTTCPACGAETFEKQVTAAGFQLKGSGWYVTDFRGGAQSSASDAGAASTKAAPGASAEPASSNDNAAGPGPSSAASATSPATPAATGNTSGTPPATST
jgi:putative FmdB family regulatory protein